MFEGRRGTALEQMEVGLLHDILRLLASGAAPGKPMQFAGVRLIKAREGRVSRGHKRPPPVCVRREDWEKIMARAKGAPPAVENNMG